MKTNKSKQMLSNFCACLLLSGAAITIKAQDTPMLVASVPANNASNVPVNTAISFTFNEPMFTGYSVDWDAAVPDQRTHYWTQDQLSFIYLFSVQLPPNTLITWELNPPGTSSGFKNLAGTQLPIGLYQGSFTTGTNNAQPQIEPIGWSAPQQFHLRVVGTAGKQVVIYGATNLTDWIPWATNDPASDPIDFTNSPSPFPPQQFYRASVISTAP